MTISDCLDRFKEYLRVTRGFSSGTVKRYSRCLERFEESLSLRGGEGGTDVLAVTSVDIEDWMKNLFFHGRNMKNSSRASKLSAIKSFFAFLLYDGAISSNEDPAARIPSPKVTKVMPQKFSTAQLSAIFAAPDLIKPEGIRDIAILKTLYGIGPRVSEIKNVTLDDIRHAGNDLLIYIHGKGAKERVVRLRSRAADAVRQWLVIRDKFAAPGERALFVSFRPPRPGTKMSEVSFNAILKKYAAAVGIKDERVFVHKLRSTFATDLYDSGEVGLIEISILMGHESIETTRDYIAISEKFLRKAAISNKRWKELENGYAEGN